MTPADRPRHELDRQKQVRQGVDGERAEARIDDDRNSSSCAARTGQTAAGAAGSRRRAGGRKSAEYERNIWRWGDLVAWVAESMVEGDTVEWREGGIWGSKRLGMAARVKG